MRGSIRDRQVATVGELCGRGSDASEPHLRCMGEDVGCVDDGLASHVRERLADALEAVQDTPSGI